MTLPFRRGGAIPLFIGTVRSVLLARQTAT
jgi:hypothetical protein